MVTLTSRPKTAITKFIIRAWYATLMLALPAVAAQDGYVGGPVCIQCHADIKLKWKMSHHALAMQHANAGTVRGDFNNREYTYNGVATTFYKKGNKFFVRTDGPDGKLADYEIKYAFGYEPLQQYLIEFPGGRLQALGIAWDTRPKDQGGQRWFHLYPDEQIDHKDPLHWTGPQQNWNYMCAECHSTELKKDYDASKRIYNTHWSEINVSCEACHGPGKDHVTWAAKPDKALKDKGLKITFPETGAELWSINTATGNAVRKEPLNNRAEVETCGRCHARRGALTDNYIFNRPLLDTHRVAMLESSLYHADGQIDDEVYVYGSFLQSKMYKNGVTCSDCHDPHTLQLRAPGHKVCLTCHSKDKYETTQHHFHKIGSAGASCVECHMPAKNYMVVDPRHDHSFRIPRPDLSLHYGTPNACTNCHTDKSDKWAAQITQKWYGDKLTRRDSYAQALHAARSGSADAGELLLKTLQDPQTPDIVRATAVSLLPQYMSPAAIQALSSALYGKDALTRMAAVRALDAVPPQARVALAAPLLSDPVLSVRIEAARLLAPVPSQAMNATQQQAFIKALAEYIAVQQFNADRPESHLNLGLLYAQRGDPLKAEANYKTAIDIDPGFIPAYVNLADLYRAQQRDSDAESLLRAALNRQPRQADAHHSLGLLLIRSKLMNEALKHLQQAAQLAPDNARYSYVYAIALHSKGDRKAALAVLEQAFAKHPTDRNILMSLVTINQEIGNNQQARQHLNELRKLSPNDPRLRELERALDGS